MWRAWPAAPVTKQCRVHDQGIDQRAYSRAARSQPLIVTEDQAMNGKTWWWVTLSAVLFAALAGAQDVRPEPPGSLDASVVKMGGIVPPRVVQPCKPGSCPF